MAIKKLGVPFFAKIDTNKDIIGAADKFKAQVINDKDGSVLDNDGKVLSLGKVSEIPNTGIYRIPVTLYKEGDYTIAVEYVDEDGNVEHIPVPIEVRSVNIDDIKGLINGLQSDMTSVKTQIDVLDEKALNGLAEQTKEVQSSVESIKKLVFDNINTVVVAGDESKTFEIGKEVKGAKSGAKGYVVASVVDPQTGNTIFTLEDVQGAFAKDEAITDGKATTKGAVLSTVVSPVDSVMEFVKEIEKALSQGGTTLKALKGYTDNLEAMIAGKEYIDANGNKVSEEDSQGLPEIFEQIKASGADVKEAQSAISDLSTQIATFRVSVESKVDDVQSAIDALTDPKNADSIVSKIAGVQSVVEANKGILTDETFGNAAIKKLLDTANGAVAELSKRFNEDGDLKGKFDNIDTAIDTVKSVVANVQTEVGNVQKAIQADLSKLNESLESKYADLSAKLGKIAERQTKLKGFV